MKLNLVLIGLVFIAFACGSGEKPAEMEEEIKGSGLPYMGFHDFGPTIKDGKEVMDTIYHTVPEFYLMAQDSAAFTNADVAGKIHVVNFFFTSCPSICPAMIGQMKRLQENTKDIKELLFLSHTVDPKRDSIPKLNAYIKERSLDTHNWFFLYGEKEEVYELGSTGYLVNAMEDEKADGGFLHSEHFVLVDREGHVRGLYDGTKNEQVDKLEQDIRLLLKKNMANNMNTPITHRPELEKKYKPLFIILSIVIPVVVAVLFSTDKIEGFDTGFLPPMYATINGITAILLVIAVISIKNGNRKRHELLIKCAIVCSLLFLVGYVAYHLTSDATKFLGTGAVAIIYYTLLISHILLSIAVIPLVLFTYLKGWAGNVVAHRKWAKITFPIWLYVAVSGVVVYLMISPYYV